MLSNTVSSTNDVSSASRAQPLPPLSKQHYVHLQNGHLASTTLDDLDHLFAHLADDPNHDRLVLYFHGGLVSKENALESASQVLFPAFYQRAHAYPVFFVWESGLPEILRNNFDSIFREPIFQRINQLLENFVTSPGMAQQSGVLGDSDGGALGGDAAEEEQLRLALENDPVVAREVALITNSPPAPSNAGSGVLGGDEGDVLEGEVRASSHTLMSPEVVEELREGTDAGGVLGWTDSGLGALITRVLMTRRRVLDRFAQQRDHGRQATIVEEILRAFYLDNAGRGVWSLMKQDTADAFGGDALRDGGTAFLAGLANYVAQGKRPRITLVGHSTGAIYICHFIKHAAQVLPKDVQFDVIFLAPACDFTLFAQTLQVYQQRIANIRIFGMQDTLEQADVLVRQVPIYPSSLLYLVSGILEDEPDTPLVGMQRYYSGLPPYDATPFPGIDAVRSYINALKGRVVWSLHESELGLGSQANSHGGFASEAHTLASVEYIIGHQF